MAPYIFSFLYEQFTARLAPIDANLAGRTFLVTGSNTGLGLALSIHLARRTPARLILAVRDLAKGENAKKEVIAQTGFEGEIHVWELDMADFASVKKFATRANDELERLDGAALNAGLTTMNWTLTTDGWERTLQVNALATGLLAILLLPLLQKTAKLPAPDASVFAMAPHLTITGSSVMFAAKFADRTAPQIIQAMNVRCDLVDRYFTTKLFNLYIARKIAGLEQAKGVVVNVVNPGLCSSEFSREMPIPFFVVPILRFVGWSPAKGALNLLYSVLNGTRSGAYITACAVSEPPPWTLDESGLRLQEKVWNEMVELWRAVEPGVDSLVKL